MKLSNEELDMLAEALNTRLQGEFSDSTRKAAMEELADKIVNNQEAEEAEE